MLPMTVTESSRELSNERPARPTWNIFTAQKFSSVWNGGVEERLLRIKPTHNRNTILILFLIQKQNDNNSKAYNW